MTSPCPAARDSPILPANKDHLPVREEQARETRPRSAGGDHRVMRRCDAGENRFREMVVPWLNKAGCCEDQEIPPVTPMRGFRVFCAISAPAGILSPTRAPGSPIWETASRIDCNIQASGAGVIAGSPFQNGACPGRICRCRLRGKILLHPAGGLLSPSSQYLP